MNYLLANLEMGKYSFPIIVDCSPVHPACHQFVTQKIVSHAYGHAHILRKMEGQSMCLICSSDKQGKVR